MKAIAYRVVPVPNIQVHEREHNYAPRLSYPSLSSCFPIMPQYGIERCNVNDCNPPHVMAETKGNKNKNEMK